MHSILQDLHYGLRQLRKSPAFTLTAILTLGLGIGATTSVFSLINGLLLRPLPVPNADQLAVLHYDRSDQDAEYSFCAPFLRALEKRHDVFQSVAAFSDEIVQVRGNSANVEVLGTMVSGQYFPTLEMPPLLGRYLTPEDDRLGGGSIGFGVVISENFWRTWFDSASDVVGRKLTISKTPFTVVGVMPRQFTGADPTQQPEIYIPLSAEPIVNAPYSNLENGHHSWWLQVIARRNPGVSLEQTNAALRAVSNSILEEAISDDAAWVKDAKANHFSFNVDPGANGYSFFRSIFKKPLIATLSLCGAMLLLACLNLASLLMARAAAREREFATRLAVGATRRRLIQQLLVESLLLVTVGAAAGIVVSPVVSRSLAAILLGNIRLRTTLDTTIDLRVFAFATLVALVAGTLTGLIPALRATSGNLNDPIKDGLRATSGREKHRLLPKLLMGSEVALALTLVTGAGLLATSLTRLYRTNLGFDSKGVVNIGLNMNQQKLEGDALARWYQSYGDALKHQPGVQNVSFVSMPPLTGSSSTDTVHTPYSKGDQEMYINNVAPDYFATMRIPLLTGREFQWNDTLASGRKVILNQAAAKTLFPGQNAIGQHMTGWKAQEYEVVGVVGDARYTSIRRDFPPEAYFPITQNEVPKPSYTAVVRTNGQVAPLAAAARSLSAKMAPETPAPVMTTISSDLDNSISSERMMAILSIFFAGCALLVTAIGLYGTLSYATVRRTNEIGIRMALGAGRTQVLDLIFRQNAWVAASGTSAGLVLALLTSRVLASLLYQTSSHDPWILLGSAAVLMLIASAASLVPALRASRIDPIQALRSE